MFVFQNQKVNYWHTRQVSTVLVDSHLQSVDFWSLPTLDGVVQDGSTGWNRINLFKDKLDLLWILVIARAISDIS